MGVEALKLTLNDRPRDMSFPSEKRAEQRASQNRRLDF
jgi:hypothetical protein